MQIIGKGGMAQELLTYIDSQGVLAEFGEINYLDPTRPTVIAIGDMRARRRLSNAYKFNYRSVIIGKVYGNCKIGEGTIICPGAILTTNISVGKHTIINVNCAVHHDCIIGDYTNISPGATLCGGVHVGDQCFIGAGSVIREKIKICDNVVIGAGAVVVKDILQPGTYVGNPCKRLK